MRTFMSKGPLRRFLKIPQWLELGLLAIAAIILLVLGFSIVWATIAPIPSIDNFQNREVAQSTKIYDRTGNIVLYDVHGTMRRVAVPLDQISPYIQHAAVAVEDATFYENAGFRPLSFARAMFINIISGGYVQGGSTITQQVVKNALLTQEKTITRKIKEIILALRLTRVYTKDQILNTYLNETAYGGTVYGVQEASQYYFGMDAKDVTLAEASYLAALPQAPTYFSPYGNHRDALDKRKNFVLQQMKVNGFITEEEYTQALAEKVEFNDVREAGIKAPHFVFYVREYLENKYGADVVSNGGLHVVTTLDYGLQQKAEEIVAKWAPQMQQNFNASNEGVVAIDPKTGHVLTMIGSRGYFDTTIDGKVNVTLSNRQPGSSFKPFVYATAFEKGYTPSTVVFDVRTQFSTHCGPDEIQRDEPPCYSPQNFDGTFKGPMTLRNALAQSENIPAVKVLYLAGIKNSISTAENMGITTLGDANQYGLTLVLGGGEVNLLEMTGAYGVFANDGVKNPPTGILRVEDNKGKVLEQYEDQSTRVIDPQITRIINDVLSDDVARIPEFGSNSPLYFPGVDVADKTGTTNDYRDVWILGYTPGIAIGAWAGNNDNTPMEKKIAAFIIAPMWHEFMDYAIQKYPADGFISPAPDAHLSSLSPVLQGNWNSNPTLGVHEILFWINKDDPRGGTPSNPSSDPQFTYWEYPVQVWVKQNMGSLFGLAGSSTPQIQPSAENTFTIASPQQNSLIPWGTTVATNILTVPNSEIKSITYYLNGVTIGVSSQPPYTVVITPNSHGVVTLRAVAQKTTGALEEHSVVFIVQ